MAGVKFNTMQFVVRTIALCLAAAPVALAQTSPRPLLDQAREAIAAGRFVDALAAQTQAIAAAPRDVAAYVARARLFDDLGQPGLAAADYRVAAKLRPVDAGLQISLCTDLALANHDLDGALAACNAAVKMLPDNPEALGARAYLQLRRGAWAEAERDYADANALQPADPTVGFGRGVALIHLGKAVQGNDEISIASLERATLVDDWRARGFGAHGEILPGRAMTTAKQPALTTKDEVVLLNAGEVHVRLANCGMIVTGKQPDGAPPYETMMWSGECRFGLIHGEGRMGPAGAPARHAYGREPGVGVSSEQGLGLAYQAVEKALKP